MLETACTSRPCESCGREIFYVRRAENGGIKIEDGDSFHLPKITLSLDPNSSGRFFRPGLESFLKQLYLEKKFEKDEIVNRFREQEAAIDAELKMLDCIQHCDLETNKGCEEAAKILQKEGMYTYFFNLARSCNLRQCYEAIEKDDTLEAVLRCHNANLFKECSLLEDEHLKEILWLGYNYYFDLIKNEGATPESIRETGLIGSIRPKIRSLESDFIYSLVNDGKNISNRINITGVSEETLKSLLKHELERRNMDQESKYKERELVLKEKDTKIKIWGFLFTLANAIILAWYKDWLN